MEKICQKTNIAREDTNVEDPIFLKIGAHLKIINAITNKDIIILGTDKEDSAKNTCYRLVIDLL